MKKRIIVCVFITCLLGIISFAFACSKNATNQITQTSSDIPVTGETENQESLTGEDLNDSAQFFISQGLIDPKNYSADVLLTRIVAARMVADITGLSVKAVNTSFTHPFIDLSASSEQLIGYLYHNNIVEGITNNHFMENNVCDESTFLVLLLRAIDTVGGEAEDIDQNNAISIAKERGILLAEGQTDDSALSVNDAFDLCYNAFFSQTGGNGETLMSSLADNGIVSQVQSDIASDPSDAYRIAWPLVKPFFKETWYEKELDGRRIIGNGRTYWYGNNARGTNNSITNNGYLELAGKDQELSTNQQYALIKNFMQGNESYGMTFTVNVQSMSNEGNQGRVIFRVIPRTADKGVTKYYAVNYYILQQLGDYESNLIHCKWSITNTNAPSGTTPLTEAYFLLKENIDYTARLLIENTDKGDVHIAFYIDGPDRYSTSSAPLLEYTDSSAYKILNSATGPAFGISGHMGAEWGYAPRVRFDDIALYTKNDFNSICAQIERLTDTPVLLGDDDAYANQLRYLVNRGVISPVQRHLDFDGNVSVAEFLATALYYHDQHADAQQTIDQFVAASYRSIFRRTEIVKNTDFSRPVNRYEAALIIQALLPGNTATTKYASLYADRLEPAFDEAVYYAVQNSYLLLDENNRFNGNDLISREELLYVFTLAVDSRLRNKNSVLTTSSIFSDNAVLQGGKPIVVSGRGMSGDEVTVSIGALQKKAKVADGIWSVEFSPQLYGGPYVMKISDSACTYKYRGVYIGEVVVVAGQSNAEMAIYETKNTREVVEQYGNYDKIRVFRPDSMVATQPTPITATKWDAIEDEYSAYLIEATSAVGVYYADQLYKLNPNLKNVKIGIIQITYGGTSIEMFMPNIVNEKEEFIQKDNEFIRSGFWNGYMAGIAPYAASALIFYQGENSTQLQYMYEPLLRDYIWGVRQAFMDESLPVMLVQISGFGDNYGQDSDNWPYIREVQMRVANTMQNVGLVTAIDLSDPNPQEIHPKVKQPIGQRLGYLAMDMVYGKNLGKLSPALKDWQRNGNTYTIRFNATALKLNEAVYGTRDFEVLDTSGRWSDAEARVEADTLYVWSDDVIEPQGVRYAWSNYPKADLFDQDNLPILPFNTIKDLNTALAEDQYTTNETMLKKSYHLLNTGDMVVNLTRDNQIRHVNVINAYLLEYSDGAIPGQAPGDEIALLKKQKDSILAQDGTNETIVSVASHNLKAGDWLFNEKYGVMTPVLEVIDANHIRVEHVGGQSSGNVLDVYRNIATVIAQK